MGRRRASGVPAAAAQADRKDNRAGGVRIVWSYLAAIIATAVAGLGFAISDTIQAGICPDSNASCTLGVIVLGGTISASLGALLAGLALGLGWEWVLVEIAVLMALPVLLDAWGPVAWLAVVLAPLLGAVVTWSGRDRPAWRPFVVGGLSVLTIVGALLWIYVL